MTDDNELDEIPTAAYQVIFPETVGGWSCHPTEHLAKQLMSDEERLESEMYELVRRKDVVEQIQDFIELERERDWKGCKNRIDVLQELKEAMQQNDG